MPFKNIFVIQILGILIARKFSGIANLVVENNNTALIWLEKGMVVRVRYSNLSDNQALKAIAWHDEGELSLEMQVFPYNPLESYTSIIEELLKDAPYPISTNYPMLMNIVISRVNLKPLKNSPLSLIGLTLLGQIDSDTQLSNIPKGNLSSQEFWNGFWYLTCNGLIMCDYAKSIGVLMQQFQDKLTAKMEKLMGPHITQAYIEKLEQNISHHCSNWKKGQTFDPVYGTSPYQVWVQTMQATTLQIGSQTLQKRCFRSTLSALSSQDSDVIHNFLTK